jgi:hypothetical protein
MANTTADLIWIQSLLQELQVPYLTLTLLCDNLGAVSLAHNMLLVPNSMRWLWSGKIDHPLCS